MKEWLHMMYTKSYHNLVVFIAFKNLCGILYNWKWINGENVWLMVIHILIYHNIVIFKKKHSISSWSSFWNILKFCHKTTNFHKLQNTSVNWKFSMKFFTYNYSKFKHNKPFKNTFDTIYLHFFAQCDIDTFNFQEYIYMI